MVERRRLYRVLVVKSEGKKQLGRPRCRWGDNIKIDLQEVVCCGMDLIDVPQGRYTLPALVNVVMNLQVP